MSLFPHWGRSVKEIGSSQLELILVHLLGGNQTKSNTEDFRDLVYVCISIRVEIKLKVNEMEKENIKANW